MYSVIDYKGFQHKVTIGEILKLPFTDAKVGDTLTVSDVLLFADGDTVSVGAPKVGGATVKLEVLAHDKDDKVLIFKRKRRKRYRLTRGHRQDYTEVLVTDIASGSAKSSVDDKAKIRARARAKALAKAKVQNVPLTKAQKIALAASGEAVAKEGK